MVLLAVSLTAQGQQHLAGERRYPEELREEVELVRRAIHHQHPDPYRYITRDALDARFDSVSAAIQVPMDEREFLLALAPALRSVGDSHLRIGPSDQQRRQWVQQERFLPIKVRVLEGELYLEEELMGFRTIPSGSRIISIDGLSSARILSDLSALVFPDGRDQVYVSRRIEQDLPALYAVRYGTRMEHVVEHASGDGAVKRVTLRSLTGEEVARSYKPSTLSLLPWRSEPMMDLHTSWITVRTLDPDSLAADHVDPERMLDLFLQEIREKEIRTVVVDVRGAGGMDMGMAELLFSLMATDPFRVVQAITMRQPEGGRDRHVPMYASTGPAAIPVEDRMISVPADDPRLAMTLPYSKAFTGKVYVVCDGLTRDAAAAFVMLAKRSGRARIVGEELGSNSTSFCGGKPTELELPRSGLVLSIPSQRFVPAGVAEGPADHGEFPHHTAVPQPWGLQRGRDTVKSALLEMIRELQ
jgi:hypothetical protein